MTMRSRSALWLALCLALPFWLGGGADPGVLLELDRERYELRARDLASGEPGPRLRVVLGSPAHPTPDGLYPLHVVVWNPSWTPGEVARSFGAEPVGPSSEGPLGVGKIPFAQNGEISLHGGADPRLLGKPVSLGCARATDTDLRRLASWLESRDALLEPVEQASGERHQHFRRPTRVRVR